MKNFTLQVWITLLLKKGVMKIFIYIIICTVHLGKWIKYGYHFQPYREKNWFHVDKFQFAIENRNWFVFIWKNLIILLQDKGRWQDDSDWGHWIPFWGGVAPSMSRTRIAWTPLCWWNEKAGFAVFSEVFFMFNASLFINRSLLNISNCIKLT